jgi:phospholipid/cholesterol/gamma-HCH transport system ATP-binding protein
MISIECHNVWKSFARKVVLRGVNLAVRPGETIVIMGQSGSGKSVLLKHIVGLLVPDRGRVLVDGVDVARLSRGKLFGLRMRFGMVFQGSALFDSLSVEENVGLAMREHTQFEDEEIRRICREKLHMVGLDAVGDKYPAELSGGMKKRVGFARAIAMNPHCVLYDEPTTGLDPITTDYVDGMIVAAKQRLGVTSMVISHDVASAFKVADRLAVLYDGHLAAEGTPAEVRASTDPYVQRYLSTWFQKQ